MERIQRGKKQQARTPSSSSFLPLFRLLPGAVFSYALWLCMVFPPKGHLKHLPVTGTYTRAGADNLVLIKTAKQHIFSVV